MFQSGRSGKVRETVDGNKCSTIRGGPASTQREQTTTTSSQLTLASTTQPLAGMEHFRQEIVASTSSIRVPVVFSHPYQTAFLGHFSRLYHLGTTTFKSLAVLPARHTRCLGIPIHLLCEHALFRRIDSEDIESFLQVLRDVAGLPPGALFAPSVSAQRIRRPPTTSREATAWRLCSVALGVRLCV